MKLLKQLFCIHSKSGKEGKIRKFIWNWVKQNVPDAKVKCDKDGNMYITKGESETYPCVVAHLDQVQENHAKDFKCLETEEVIIGFSKKRLQQQGLGADDKVGIWIGLKCLQRFDAIKLAYFVGEETGCIGSDACDMTFFDDCRFVIQCDRRGHEDLVTEISWTQLCSKEFLDDIRYWKFGYRECIGLMTDVETLKNRGLAVSCINMSCGYYKPHTDQEFVYKPAVLNCLAFVEHIVTNCTKVYPHKDETRKLELHNYYGDYYGYYSYYDDIYEIMHENPYLSFGEIEGMFKEMYGCINRDELEGTYELVREDLIFWKQQEEKESEEQKQITNNKNKKNHV